MAPRQHGEPGETPTAQTAEPQSHELAAKREDGIPAPLSEEQFAAELCAMGRHAARATGRAPLDPPEQVRHQRLEAVRNTVDEALKGGGAHPVLQELQQALKPNWHEARAAGRV